MFLGKPFPGPAKARLDFVKNEQDAVPVAQFAQSLHECCWWDNISTLTQYRFDQDGGGLSWGGLREQEFFQRSETVILSSCASVMPSL